MADGLDAGQREKHALLSPYLNERQRRLIAAADAKMLGCAKGRNPLSATAPRTLGIPARTNSNPHSATVTITSETGRQKDSLFEGRFRPLRPPDKTLPGPSSRSPRRTQRSRYP